MLKYLTLVCFSFSLLLITNITNAAPITTSNPASSSVSNSASNSQSNPTTDINPNNANATSSNATSSNATSSNATSSNATSSSANTTINVNKNNIANNKLTARGIYVTQYIFENTAYLSHLIAGAKRSGINTFVVDLEKPSKRYQENLSLLKDNGIRYVARIIMFPGGGTPEQIENPAVWQKKYTLVQQAANWGAKEIQLDYIRYNTKQKPSPNNAKNVLQIISWYKNKLSGQNIPLQIDVFGIASFGESKYIGQNVKLFSESVDAICPMVYPSHYVPYAEHFQRPYETVFDSLKHLKKQFGGDEGSMPIKMYPYIELSNYHFPMSRPKTLQYIQAQIKAAHDAGADGWYAWSPHNRYDNLFKVLENQKNTIAD